MANAAKTVLKDKKQYKPNKKQGFISRTKLFLFAILINLGNLFSAFHANAADTGDFKAIEIANTDLSVKYLNAIFGRFGPLDGIQEKTIIGDIMYVWNGATLVLGTILVSYIVLSGVLKSAHEGEFLGRQWSSIWVPFRSAVAMSMILPLGTGYSMIQGGGMWCVLQGVGIANIVNVGGMEYLSSKGGLISVPQPANGLNITSNLFKQLVCVESLNKYLAETESPYTANLIEGNNTSFTWGNADYNSGIGKQACGGMKWSSWGGTTLQLATANGATLGNTFFNFWNGATDVADKIDDAQSQSIAVIISQLRPIAKEFAADPDHKKLPSISQFNAIAGNYNSIMAKTVASYTEKYANSASNLSSVTEATKKDGWISLGAFFTKITHINDVMANIVDSQETNLGEDFELPDNYAEQINVNLKAVDEFINEVARNNMSGLEQARREAKGIKTDQMALNETRSAISMAVSTGDTDSMNSDFFALFDLLNGGIIETLEKDENPITRMQNLGNMILDVYGTVKLVEGAAYLFTGGKSTAIKEGLGKASEKGGKFLAEFGGSIAGLTTMLLVTGVSLAIIMPMIPFLLWTLGVFSWFTSVLIAMVATPLWAVSHATPNGDDAMGSGSNGYIMLMSITLRPVLMLFGFYGAMLLLFAIDKFISVGFSTALSMSQSNSSYGPIVAITGVVIYTVFHIIILISAFKLIQRVPDAILNWVGGRDDDVTDVASNSEQANTRIYAAISTGQQHSMSLKKSREEKLRGGSGSLSGA